VARDSEIHCNSEYITYCGKVYEEEILQKVLCKINKLVPVVLFPSKSTTHPLLNRFQIGFLLEKKRQKSQRTFSEEISENFATVRSYLEACIIKTILGYRISQMIICFT
jgi:hypothetical protein